MRNFFCCCYSHLFCSNTRKRTTHKSSSCKDTLELLSLTQFGAAYDISRYKIKPMKKIMGLFYRLSDEEYESPWNNAEPKESNFY
jgi:hypothetical protein